MIGDLIGELWLSFPRMCSVYLRVRLHWNACPLEARRKDSTSFLEPPVSSVAARGPVQHHWSHSLLGTRIVVPAPTYGLSRTYHIARQGMKHVRILLVDACSPRHMPVPPKRSANPLEEADLIRWIPYLQPASEMFLPCWFCCCLFSSFSLH